jgi:hypothetical protein
LVTQIDENRTRHAEPITIITRNTRTVLSDDCRRLQSAGAASIALGTSASSHSSTISATILSATFCRYFNKQAVSTSGLRRVYGRTGRAKGRVADLLIGGEEVEELQHGRGDAVAEALVRAFLAY